MELVNTVAAAKYGYPLSLWSYDEGLRKKLNDALYVASATGEQHAPASITYEYSDGGTIVRKRFSFDHSYVVKAETSVYVNGGAVQAYPAWPAGFGDQTTPASYAAATIDYQSGDKIERIAVKKVSGGNTIRGPFHWAAAADQYFAAVFLPSAPEDAVMVTLQQSLEIPKDREKPDPTKVDKITVLGAAVGNASGPTEERIFVGPKTLDVLKTVHASLSKEELARLAPAARASAEGPNLEDLVNFGEYLGFIAKPLFLWLKWTHDHWVPNWGWSIVIVTLIINVAMFPLKWSSMKSSLKMAKIAPQIKAIQEKYKKYKLSDPRRQEMNPEDLGAVQERGRQPGGRLRAHGAADAVLVRVLPHAGCGRRTAARALSLDERSIVARPISHLAHRHHPHHVPVAEDDSGRRHGPDATEDDVVHHAGIPGGYQLVTVGGAVRVLGAGQRDRDRAADDREPNEIRP